MAPHTLPSSARSEVVARARSVAVDLLVDLEGRVPDEAFCDRLVSRLWSGWERRHETRFAGGHVYLLCHLRTGEWAGVYWRTGDEWFTDGEDRPYDLWDWSRETPERRLSRLLSHTHMMPTAVSLTALADAALAVYSGSDAGLGLDDDPDTSPLLFPAVARAIWTSSEPEAEPVRFLIELDGYGGIGRTIRALSVQYATERLEAEASQRLSRYLHAGRVSDVHAWLSEEGMSCLACDFVDVVTMADMDELGLDPERGWDGLEDRPSSDMESMLESMLSWHGSRWMDEDGVCHDWSASPARLMHTLVADELARRQRRPQPVPDLEVPDLEVPDLEVPDLEVPDLEVPDLEVSGPVPVGEGGPGNAVPDCEPVDDEEAWQRVGSASRGFIETVDAALAGWEHTLRCPGAEDSGSSDAVSIPQVHGWVLRYSSLDAAQDIAQAVRPDGNAAVGGDVAGVALAVFDLSMVPSDEEWAQDSFAARMQTMWRFFELVFYGHPEVEEVVEALQQYLRGGEHGPLWPGAEERVLSVAKGHFATLDAC